MALLRRGADARAQLEKEAGSRGAPVTNLTCWKGEKGLEFRTRGFRIATVNDAGNLVWEETQRDGRFHKPVRDKLEP